MRRRSRSVTTPWTAVLRIGSSRATSDEARGRSGYLEALRTATPAVVRPPSTADHGTRAPLSSRTKGTAVPKIGDLETADLDTVARCAVLLAKRARARFDESPFQLRPACRLLHRRIARCDGLADTGAGQDGSRFLYSSRLTATRHEIDHGRLDRTLPSRKPAHDQRRGLRSSPEHLVIGDPARPPPRDPAWARPGSGCDDALVAEKREHVPDALPQRLPARLCAAVFVTKRTAWDDSPHQQVLRERCHGRSDSTRCTADTRS
jgi:hypothetical protein